MCHSEDPIVPGSLKWRESSETDQSLPPQHTNSNSFALIVKILLFLKWTQYQEPFTTNSEQYQQDKNHSFLHDGQQTTETVWPEQDGRTKKGFLLAGSKHQLAAFSTAAFQRTISGPFGGPLWWPTLVVNLVVPLVVHFGGPLGGPLWWSFWWSILKIRLVVHRQEDKTRLHTLGGQEARKIRPSHQTGLQFFLAQRNY